MPRLRIVTDETVNDEIRKRDRFAPEARGQISIDHLVTTCRCFTCGKAMRPRERVYCKQESGPGIACVFLCAECIEPHLEHQLRRADALIAEDLAREGRHISVTTNPDLRSNPDDPPPKP